MLSQKAMTNTEDLSKVATLELCVDTQHNTLGNFGKGEILYYSMQMDQGVGNLWKITTFIDGDFPLA